ncbi:ATP-dependent Clp protease ATP-binding subunit [Escherichia coli]|uniref:ATP-dependent Clp protease ATP-binding subunit n=1 Tax=Escherichia coli TaxID=562 RepID=A0A485JKQ9_ECOLX|nr:ATP-dependent Clp protease ATP-binding subunit [Escherichia coli]
MPEVMADCTIYSLDIGSLLAGTKYRGDFENVLKALLKQLEQDTNSICLLMRSTPLSVRVQRLVVRSMRLT